jgi:CBS domain-containing protein
MPNNYKLIRPYNLRGGYMKIKDIMHDIVRAPYDISVASVAVLMEKKVTGSVLLEDKGEPIGIVTERDVLRKVVARNRNPMNVRAIDIASYPLIAVDPDASLEEATEKMANNNIRRILVMQGNQVLGKVTAGAVAKNARYIIAERMISQRCR